MGVRKMVHKIWDKDVGDNEPGSVREVLMKGFYDIHMDPPKTDIASEITISENLIRYL